MHECLWREPRRRRWGSSSPFFFWSSRFHKILNQQRSAVYLRPSCSLWGGVAQNVAIRRKKLQVLGCNAGGGVQKQKRRPSDCSLVEIGRWKCFVGFLCLFLQRWRVKENLKTVEILAINLAELTVPSLWLLDRKWRRMTEVLHLL